MTTANVTRPRPEMLTAASLAFVLANLAHTLDHIRQGVGRLTPEVLGGGSLISLLALVTLFLALRRHLRAPLFAAVVGFTSAAGISASHLAPHWGVFSDSYPQLHVDALAWLIVSAEIAAGIFLGGVGMAELRRQSESADA